MRQMWAVALAAAAVALIGVGPAAAQVPELPTGGVVHAKVNVSSTVFGFPDNVCPIYEFVGNLHHATSSWSGVARTGQCGQDFPLTGSSPAGELTGSCHEVVTNPGWNPSDPTTAVAEFLALCTLSVDGDAPVTEVLDWVIATCTESHLNRPPRGTDYDCAGVFRP